MIFVDSRAWYALKTPDDRFHDDAIAFRDALESGQHGSLVVLDRILDETATMLMTTKGRITASKFMEEASSSRSVRLIWIDPDLFHEATKIFKTSSETG